MWAIIVTPRNGKEYYVCINKSKKKAIKFFNSSHETDLSFKDFEWYDHEEKSGSVYFYKYEKDYITHKTKEAMQKLDQYCDEDFCVWLVQCDNDLIKPMQRVIEYL
jgi:uncharacterized C2H2 Zn-finger protein